MGSTTSRSHSHGAAATLSACFIHLLLGSLLVGSGACRRTPPAPVPLSVGITDVGIYTAETGIAVLVSSLEDERLFRLTPDGHFEPALAERYEESADGLTWTFHLRKGLTFHNGVPLDAQTLATRFRSSRGYDGRAGFRDIVSYEATGPLDLVVHLRRPSHFVLDAMVLQPIRSPGPNSAGAGPFKVLSRNNSKATFTAFSGYYRGTPAISEVSVQTYKGGRTAWSALMRNEIDVLFEVSPDAADFVQGSSATQVKSFLRSYVTTLGFNMKHPVLRQRAVRTAISQAVNRDQIVKELFGGRATAATSMLWPNHWAYDATQPGFRYDPADAARLLDAAGLPIKKAGTGGQMPSRFRFTCLLPLLPTGAAQYERMGLMLQRQLSELGIDMQLEALPTQDLVNRIGSGNYDVFLFEVLTHDLDWVYNFWHSPEEGSVPLLDTGYKSADAALDRLRAARTDDATKAAVAELERVMHDDPPAVPLVWSRVSRAVNHHFRLPDVKDRDIWPTIWQWQPVPASDRPSLPAIVIAPPTIPR